MSLPQDFKDLVIETETEIMAATELGGYLENGAVIVDRVVRY